MIGQTLVERVPGQDEVAAVVLPVPCPRRDASPEPAVVGEQLQQPVDIAGRLRYVARSAVSSPSSAARSPVTIGPQRTGAHGGRRPARERATQRRRCAGPAAPLRVGERDGAPHSRQARVVRLVGGDLGGRGDRSTQAEARSVASHRPAAEVRHGAPDSAQYRTGETVRMGASLSLRSVSRGPVTVAADPYVHAHQPGLVGLRLPGARPSPQPPRSGACASRRASPGHGEQRGDDRSDAGDPLRHRTPSRRCRHDGSPGRFSYSQRTSGDDAVHARER